MHQREDRDPQDAIDEPDDWEDIEPEEVGFQIWEPEDWEDDEPEPEEGDFWMERDNEEEL